MCHEQAHRDRVDLFRNDNAFTSEHKSNNGASAIERFVWLFWVDNLTANGLRESLRLVEWKEYSRKLLFLF
jgi:hypothetical protein